MGHVDPCHINTVIVLIVAACYMCHLGFPTGYGDFASSLCNVDQYLCYIENTTNTAPVGSVNCNVNGGGLNNCTPKCARRYQECLNSITTARLSNIAIAQILTVLTVLSLMIYIIFYFLKGGPKKDEADAVEMKNM